MSIVRNLANHLAAFLVRHASAASKEWSEAIASELDFIENDWRALAWALSGLRVLFIHPLTPLHTLADLGTAAQEYAETRRQEVNNVWLGRNLPWLVLLINAAALMPRIFLREDPLGHGAVVLGLLTFAFLQYLRRREPVVPDRDDLHGLIRFYKQELTRSAKISSVTFWLYLACFLLVAAGYEMIMAYTWERVMGVLWLLPFALFLAQAHKHRRRVAQIDALLATTE